MCNHKLAVATYDASEVFCDLCPQRWKVDDILKIAEGVINAAQQGVQSDGACTHGDKIFFHSGRVCCADCGLPISPHR